MKGLLFLLVICAAQLGFSQRPFLRGGDVSEIPEEEAAGAKYFYKGQQEDPLKLLKQAGWNYIRLRIWNNPKDGFCDESHTLAMAKRAKAAGLMVGIDFHYSDYWADPGKQYKPAAWKNLSFEDLAKAVHDYTKEVVSKLVAHGTPPYMVQVGNEIGAGMLWPDGKITSADPNEWQRLSTLLKAGIQGVHDGQGANHILTMIHLERGGDNSGAVWWFDHLAPYGVDFDVIGLSYYPFWHGHLSALKANLADLGPRYKKPIYIAETAYPWTADVPGHFSEILSKLESGYPATPLGQSQFLKQVIDITKQDSGGYGSGIFYWAPTWISTPQRSIPWDVLATFNKDGKALPAVDTIGGKN
ncbi:MAG TPA: glycosyl hydrolase 53 family protein [Fimbriimonadaceae bacterium]|jgi:arabinogalactan endo-1,4-beta-galactosidase